MGVDDVVELFIELIEQPRPLNGLRERFDEADGFLLSSTN